MPINKDQASIGGKRKVVMLKALLMPMQVGNLTGFIAEWYTRVDATLNYKQPLQTALQMMIRLIIFLLWLVSQADYVSAYYAS